MALDEKYKSGELEPRETVREVGRILADLTVDDIGWLSETANAGTGSEDEEHPPMCYQQSAAPALPAIDPPPGKSP